MYPHDHALLFENQLAREINRKNRQSFHVPETDLSRQRCIVAIIVSPRSAINHRVVDRGSRVTKFIAKRVEVTLRSSGEERNEKKKGEANSMEKQ